MSFSASLSAGILGPDNYEECVLDNLGDHEQPTSETISIIQQSCRKLFPAYSTDFLMREYEVKRLKLEECGLTFNSNGTVKRILYTIQDKPNNKRVQAVRKALKGLQEVSQKLHKVDAQESVRTISFLNSNPYSLEAVLLGLTAQSMCPRYSEDYEFTQRCAKVGGIGQNSFGTMSCESRPASLDEWKVCLIGVAPLFDEAYIDSSISILKINDFCN